MDNVFFKKLDESHWLGLRLPSGMAITTDGGNRLDVAPPPAMGETPAPKWPAGAEFYGPGAGVVSEEPTLDWRLRDITQPFGHAYSDVLADLRKEDGGTGKYKDMIDSIEAVREKSAISLPLRCYRAYIDIKGTTGSRTTDQWRQVCFDALSPRPGQLPIEAFGGLLFLVNSSAPPQATGGAPLFVDPVVPGAKIPGLQLRAFQHSAGIAFELSDVNGGGPYTNATVNAVLDAGVGEGAGFSGYYRITRTLGVVERPSKRSGLVVIPRSVSGSGAEATVVGAAMAAGDVWDKRQFRPADRLMADELIGELLNYRLELLNPHGSVVRAGRVMLQRQRLDPPAAMTRAMARLLRDTAETHLVIRFDLPPTEMPDGSGLAALLYRLETPALPTGFYADADDAAIQVARLLSDIDPMAVANARATDQLPPGASSETSQASLSNHGLSPYPDQSGKPLSEMTIRKPALPPGDQSGSNPWHELQWEWKLDPEQILAAGKAVRLLLALRRIVPPDSAGYAYDGAIPESPVLELQMAIGFDLDDTVGDLSVLHFERFWDKGVALPLLDEDRVFLSEAPEDAPRAIHAQIRLQLQHLVPSAPAADPVGGYRIWMRDVPSPHGEPIRFEPVAVVQAVPQLVKAYAPVEMGRHWFIEQAAAKDDLASTADVAERRFLTPLSGMIRREDEPGNIEAAIARLNEEIDKDNAVDREARNSRSASLLFAAWRLLPGTDCKEVVLTVEQRRALVRNGAGAWTAGEGSPGNWILFRDQNGGFLGRAWVFRGAQAVRFRRFYVLREVPNTQDTVAIDDFGQVVWNWTGLKDGWHHELEWAVEPLSRYAPLRRRAETLAASSRKRPEDRLTEPPPDWLGNSLPIVDPFIRRHSVLRREPFDGRRVGLFQATESAQDAFVWKATLPAEFHRALHNTEARTPLGVLRIERFSTQMVPLLKDHFNVPVLEALLQVWCEQPVGPEKKPAIDSPAILEGHELVVHQPAAFRVKLGVRPRADELTGAVTNVEATRQPIAFSNKAVMLRDNWYMTPNKKVLVLPLARLDWSYTGPAQPTVNEILGATADAPVPAGSNAGMRLPDPHASATVFAIDDEGVLRPCAHYFGPAVPEVDRPRPPGWKPSDLEVVFGVAFVDGKTCTKVDFDSGGDDPGHLRINLQNVGVPKHFRVLWTRSGASSSLLPPLAP